jgi:hypothetical protein
VVAVVLRKNCAHDDQRGAIICEKSIIDGDELINSDTSGSVGQDCGKSIIDGDKPIKLDTSRSVAQDVEEITNTL